jgi:copper chaperone CopZ
VAAEARSAHPRIQPMQMNRRTRETTMNETITYSVPGMSCGHCRAAITAEVAAVPGVRAVDVDLDAKLVAISGESLDGAALVAAIDEAGYEAVPA